MNRKCLLSLPEIVRLYTIEHLTCEEIGRKANLTRQTIAHLLKKAGVDSSQGERVKVTCDYCLTVFIQLRCKWRKAMKHYCCAEHYYAALGKSGYIPWRQGSRLARAIVAQHFALKPEHIVHHEDRNDRNNDRANLRVFANQADHMAYHRGRPIIPLWDGSRVD